MMPELIISITGSQRMLLWISLEGRFYSKRCTGRLKCASLLKLIEAQLGDQSITIV